MLSILRKHYLHQAEPRHPIHIFKQIYRRTFDQNSNGKDKKDTKLNSVKIKLILELYLESFQSNATFYSKTTVVDVNVTTGVI